MHDLTLPFHRPETLRDHVASLLRQAIISGEYPPDTMINQANVAKKLRISRSPLREALGQLQHEGLITVIPYRGAYVSRLTEADIDELYSLRVALETFGVRRAAERVSQADVDGLRTIIDHMRAAGEAGDSARLTELDLGFHRTLIRLADHNLLLATWRHLEGRVQRCLALYHLVMDDLIPLVDTHPGLLAAVAARDAEHAADVLRGHIEAGHRTVLRALKSAPARNDVTPK